MLVAMPFGSSQGNWTHERIERLKSLWADGLSASQIAAELGGVSRCSVIGKVHRLGLPGRAHKDGNGLNPFTGAPKKRARKPRSKPFHFGAPQPVLPAELTSEPETQPAPPPPKTLPAASPCSLLDLAEGKCRYPIGDPGKPDFHFCGGKATDGLPYCGGHARLCYRPAGTQRGERKSWVKLSAIQLRAGRAA